MKNSSTGEASFTVLVVEDNANQLKVLTDILTTIGLLGGRYLV